MFSLISFFYLRDMCGAPSSRCIGYLGYLGEDVVGERGSISGIAGGSGQIILCNSVLLIILFSSLFLTIIDVFFFSLLDIVLLVGACPEPPPMMNAACILSIYMFCPPICSFCRSVCLSVCLSLIEWPCGLMFNDGERCPSS